MVTKTEDQVYVDISKVVLKIHTGVEMRGIIASLSIPWGFSKGDDDLGGYHLVWPRDMVEAAGALVAIGANEEVRRTLSYLEATQESDGHWPQNMWMDGESLLERDTDGRVGASDSPCRSCLDGRGYH